jgi:hypothetical protein
MMPSPVGHMCKQPKYQIKRGAKHGRWLYWGNKKQFPHSGFFAWLESGGGLGGVERNGRTWLHLVLASTRLPLSRLETVANQRFFRAPVRFDFLATGRENEGPTEVIDNH